MTASVLRFLCPHPYMHTADSKMLSRPLFVSLTHLGWGFCHPVRSASCTRCHLKLSDCLMSWCVKLKKKCRCEWTLITLNLCGTICLDDRVWHTLSSWHRADDEHFIASDAGNFVASVVVSRFSWYSLMNQEMRLNTVMALSSSLIQARLAELTMLTSRLRFDFGFLRATPGHSWVLMCWSTKYLSWSNSGWIPFLYSTPFCPPGDNILFLVLRWGACSGLGINRLLGTLAMTAWC